MSQGLTETDLIAQAMGCLSHHSTILDPLAPVTPHVLACRLQPGSCRIVLRLLGEGVDLVLKYDADVTVDEFEASMSAQKYAFDTMGCEYVPEILSVDAASCSALQRHVAARPVHEVLAMAELGLENAEEVLRTCGAWMAVYHETTKQPSRNIQPDRWVEWSQTLRARVAGRGPDVPRRDLFLACADRIPALGERARGQLTNVAASHGDMHLRNLLLGSGGCYGIDFEPLKYAPPALDLARFLLRYGTWFDFGPEPLAAFWDGYGAQPKDDPALGYLWPILLLEDWLAIPKHKGDRTAKQQRRLQGVLRMANDMIARGV